VSTRHAEDNLQALNLRLWRNRAAYSRRAWRYHPGVTESSTSEPALLPFTGNPEADRLLETTRSRSSSASRWTSR
jgi:hypothetical protein